MGNPLAMFFSVGQITPIIENLKLDSDQNTLSNKLQKKKSANYFDIQ